MTGAPEINIATEALHPKMKALLSYHAHYHGVNDKMKIEFYGSTENLSTT